MFFIKKKKKYNIVNIKILPFFIGPLQLVFSINFVFQVNQWMSSRNSKVYTWITALTTLLFVEKQRVLAFIVWRKKTSICMNKLTSGKLL